MTTQMGSASNSPPGTLTNRPSKRQNGRPTRLTHGKFNNLASVGYIFTPILLTNLLLVLMFAYDTGFILNFDIEDIGNIKFFPVFVW